MSIPRSILVATDFGPCSDAAVSDAYDLAARLQAKVHLIHAFAFPDVPEGALGTGDLIEEAQRNADQKMATLIAGRAQERYPGERIVRMGDPAQVVLQAAEELGVDLIVVGTHGRKGIKRLLIGSVAETLVRHAQVDVLVVRPRNV